MPRGKPKADNEIAAVALVQPRVRARWVASRTSLSIRKVQELAQQGRIPTARLGGVWTFDPDQIDAWIKARETGLEGAPAQLSIPGPVPYRGSYKWTGESVNEAYERLVLKKRPKSPIPEKRKPENFDEDYFAMTRGLRKNRPKS